MKMKMCLNFSNIYFTFVILLHIHDFPFIFSFCFLFLYFPLFLYFLVSPFLCQQCTQNDVINGSPFSMLVALTAVINQRVFFGLKSEQS